MPLARCTYMQMQQSMAGAEGDHMEAEAAVLAAPVVDSIYSTVTYSFDKCEVKF